MKHIKTYKIFEEYGSEIIETIKDICLEIDDKGYATCISHDVAFNYFLWVNKKRNEMSSPAFQYDEVKDVIDRLKDYLGNKLLWTRMMDVNSTWVDITGLEPIAPIYIIKIKFRDI